MIQWNEQLIVVSAAAAAVVVVGLATASGKAITFTSGSQFVKISRS